MDVKKAKGTEAPEGGWGYMICVGVTIIHLVLMAPKNCAGIIFKDLIVESTEGAKVYTSVYGMCGIMISLAGIIIHSCLKWFSLRQICMFGALSYILAWTGDLFITKVSQLILTEGFLNGLGFGLMNMISFIFFNSYFVKKRVMMMSVCMAIAGFGSIISPFVYEHWLAEYGYKGTIALITAISLNIFVGCLLYRPLECTKHEEHELKEVNVKTRNDVERIHDEEQKIVLEPLVDINKNETTTTKNESIWQKISERLGLKMLKRLTYVNICLATGTGIINDVYFCVLLPLLLYEYGFSVSEAAQCESIISIADLVSRIFLIIVGKCIKIRSYHWYIMGIFLTMIGRLLILQVTSFLSIAILLGFLGFLRAWIWILFPLLTAEELPDEDYSKTLTFLYVFKGIYNVVYSPILGIAKDLSGSYVITFYILALSLIFPVLIFIYDYLFIRTKKLPVIDK